MWVQRVDRLPEAQQPDVPRASPAVVRNRFKIVAAPPLAATPALSARVAHGLLLAFLLPGLRSEYSGPSTGHWAFFGRPTCG